MHVCAVITSYFILYMRGDEDVMTYVVYLEDAVDPLVSISGFQRQWRKVSNRESDISFGRIRVTRFIYYPNRRRYQSRFSNVLRTRFTVEFNGVKVHEVYIQDDDGNSSSDKCKKVNEYVSFFNQVIGIPLRFECASGTHTSKAFEYGGTPLSFKVVNGIKYFNMAGFMELTDRDLSLFNRDCEGRVPCVYSHETFYGQLDSSNSWSCSAVK